MSPSSLTFSPSFISRVAHLAPTLTPRFLLLSKRLERDDIVSFLLFLSGGKENILPVFSRYPLVRSRCSKGGGEKISVTVSNLREREDEPDYIHDRWCRDEYLPSTSGISWARRRENFDAFCVIGCAFHSRSPISRDLLCLYAVIYVDRYAKGFLQARKSYRNIVIHLPRNKSGSRETSVD